MSKEIKIGDTVKCINNKILPHQKDSRNIPNLRLNGLYIVNDINHCSCGGIALDVGLSTTPREGYTFCGCGKNIPDRSVHWCARQRFAKIASSTSSKEEEDYEMIDNSELVKQLLTKEMELS